MSRFRVLRGVLIGLAVFAGVVLCASLAIRLYGAAKLRAATARFEREVGPLTLLDFVRPRIPAEENAVTWLRPGVLAVVLFRSDRSLVGDVSSKPFAEWTAEERAAFEPLAERNGPALQILGRARGMTQSSWEIPYERGSQAKLPDLLAAMNAGKLVAAHGRRAAARGDRETALADVEILGALARSHEQEPALIVLLIGASLERHQLALIKEIVTAPWVDGTALDRLEGSLSAVDLPRKFRDSLRGEAAALLHDLRSSELQGQIPRGVPRAAALGLADFAGALAVDSRREVEASTFGPVTSPIRDERDAAGTRGWLKRLADVYAPHIEGAAARGTATMSARELARLAITLRRQEIETGAYPSAIEAPVDPLSGAPYAFAATAHGVEVRSTTTLEILKSIYPVALPLNDQLYAWSLPASSRAPTPSRRPAARRGATPS